MTYSPNSQGIRCPSYLHDLFPIEHDLLLIYKVILYWGNVNFPIFQLANVTLPNDAYLEYGIYTSNITSRSQVPLLTDNSTIGLLVSNAHIICEKHGLGLMDITNTTQPVFNALEIVFHWCVNTYDTSVGMASLLLL
jgi:hypothetical protein